MIIPGYMFPILGVFCIVASFLWVAHLLSRIGEKNILKSLKTVTSVLDKRINQGLSYLYFLKTRSGKQGADEPSRQEIVLEIQRLDDQIEAAYNRMSEEVCIVENEDLLEVLTTEYDKVSRELREIEENFETVFLSSQN